jgi:OFA family oxalate/formate antiporter-like MFS transporter
MTSTPTGLAGRREKFTAIAAVFVGLAAGYGSSYAATATAFILPLTAEFRWGRTIPSLMYVSSMLGIAIASIWLGRVIERVGAAAVAASSGVSLALVMALLSTLSGSPSIAVGLCFFAGALGAGTSVGLYLSILPGWFDRDLGRALGISIMGLSVGVTIMPALAAAIISAHGWRSAYLVLAAIQLTLTLATALALLWLGRAARINANAASVALQSGMDLSQALRTRSFWVLAVIIFFVTAGVFGTALHLFPLYADRGVARALLPTVAMTAGVGTLVGRFTSGFLLDHVDARIVAASTFFIGAIAIFWLALSGQIRMPVSLYLPPVLLGMALGAESDILTYLVRRLYGLHHCAAIYNRLLVSYYLGAITGPLALGWASDHLSDSRPVIVALAASCLAAGLATGSLPAPNRS